jgi:tRNA A-37 threonylcarbamoyl transferase component Bud32
VATSFTDNMQIDNPNFFQEIAWRHLKTASRATLESFQIVLKDNVDALYCHEIVRVIPGKRTVAFGTWGGKEVVAKLFYEPRNAMRHARRDAQGIKALLAAGVQTPLLYFQGKSKDNRVQVLIFEKINGVNLERIWQKSLDEPEIIPLMQAVTIELATQHVLGILQHDLHFKNYILCEKKLYSIDGGDVEIFDEPLSKKDSLENLALFFSQLGVGRDKLQQSLFQVYAKSRGWIIKKQDLQLLETSLNKCTNKRLENYTKKIMRECSAFSCQQNAAQLMIYDREFESQEFLTCLKNLDMMIASPAATVLKDGRSATVVKVSIDSRPFIIKRYNMKNALHWLRRCLRPSRAAKSWRLGQRLSLLGIATAKPVAFVETRFLGLRGKSYLLMEYVEGEHSGEYFAAYVRDTESAATTANKIISLLENLAKLHLTHGDLKMTNILFEKQSPILIDLDGMHEHYSLWRFKLAFHQEIKRFMKNWRDRPTIYALFEQRVREMYKRLDMQW